MQKLNDDISTIMRQVSCYMFEQELHNNFRKQGYLSKEEIGILFQKHMSNYMGEFVEQSSGSENWWVYWSHIRNFFYVYSYSSGLLISKSLQNSVKKYGHITQSEESSGDYITASKNCEQCYHANDAEDCKYAVHVRRNSKSVMDSDTVGIDSQLAYECINTAIESSNNIFCVRCWTVSESIYCNECDNSSNLF